MNNSSRMAFNKFTGLGYCPCELVGHRCPKRVDNTCQYPRKICAKVVCLPLLHLTNIWAQTLIVQLSNSPHAVVFRAACLDNFICARRASLSRSGPPGNLALSFLDARMSTTWHDVLKYSKSPNITGLFWESCEMQRYNVHHGTTELTSGRWQTFTLLVLK